MFSSLDPASTVQKHLCYTVHMLSLDFIRQYPEQVRAAPVEARAEPNKRVKATVRDIRQLELQISDIDTRLQFLLLNLPNIPHDGVDDGEGDADDRELRRWGEPLPIHFEPRAHWDLGERLQLIDFEGGARVAGSRFVALRGAGARLERALISFMLDLHTREHNYTEVI